MDEAIDQPQESEMEVADGNDASAPAASNLMELRIVTSNAELTFDEALGVISRRGGRLVMLMGETGTGKTTLITELWTHLVGLEGVTGFRLAGSCTAMPFEKKAFLSRLAAGVEFPDTRRTQMDQDEGLLHLRLAPADGVRLEVLFADYAGERYRHIKDGTPLLEEFPWTARVDRYGVLVDGSALADGAKRERTMNSATRQVYALRVSGVSHPTARVAIVLTKLDQVDDAAFRESEARLERLLTEARIIDPEAQMVRVAARPADGTDPVGLDAFLTWLCADGRPDEVPPVSLPPAPIRAVARFGSR